MKKCYPFLLLAFSLCLTQTIFGQATITGTVLDGETQEPLIGVNVIIGTSSSGTTTDIDGRYTIEIPSRDIELQYSYIGYETVYKKIGASNIIDVALPIASETLEEVVLIGYGSVKKSDLTGAVSTIKQEDIRKVPDANVLNAIQGKAASVQVSNTSGNPGDNPVVRIRGIGTFLGGASPIFVVDGVILNDIAFLSNSDIKSIEILKDASATAIYGTRGANGVIIIETFTGEAGKTRISVDASYSVEQVANKIDLLNGPQFANAVNQIFPGTYNNIEGLPNTNWQDEIFNDLTPIQNYNISFSGGNEKTLYYFGASLYDQEGIIDKSDYQRITLKFNNSLKATDFLTIGSNLTFAREEKENPAGVVPIAYRAWPLSAPFTDDGEFAEVMGSSNPLAAIEFRNSTDERNIALGNIYAEVDFLEDFKFRSSYQVNYRLKKVTSFTPQFMVSPAQQNEINNLNKESSDDNTWIWENTVNWNKELGIHRLDIVAGYTAQETNNERIGGGVQDLVRETSDLWYLEAGDVSTITAFNGEESFSYASMLFRVNYVLNNKYLFTGTFRRDGSSRFSEDNRYGNFPAFAVGWKISEEAFAKDWAALDNLKFRASWGINGNDQIPFQSRFARIGLSELDAVLGRNEDLIPGATITDVGNADLKWESTESIDIGLEFGFFDNKLSGELGYFLKQTQDVLVPLILPAHFGNGAFNRVVFNAADVNNSGLEASLSYRNRVNKDWNYEVTFIASTLQNEVKGLGAADEFLQDGNLGNGQLVTRTEAGSTVGAFYGYQVIGVLQSAEDINTLPTLSGQRPGDLQYEDIDGDGRITPEDRTFLGSYIPNYLLGLNFTVGYKGLELSVDLQGQFGNEIYNGKKAVRPELYNFEANVADAWTGPGTSNSEPRVTGGGLNYSPSSYFVEDGSFVRIRSLSLSYDLQPIFSNSVKAVQNARVFARATNLATFTDFTGYSPELASNNVLASGIDLGTYPITTVYTLGLSVGF